MSDRNNKLGYLINTIIYGTSQLFAMFRGLIILFLITSKLSIHDYGLWSQTVITATLLIPILILGLDQAIVRYLPGKENKEEYFNGIFYGVLLIVAVISFFFLVIAGLVSKNLSQLIFANEKYSNYIYMIILLAGAQVLFRYLLNYWRIIGNIKKYSLIRITFDSFLAIGLIAIIYWGELGIYNGLIYWLILLLLFSITLLAIILQERKFVFLKKVHSFYPYFIYSSPLVLFAITSWLISSSDRYFIVNNFDLSEAGIYSAAYLLGQVATFSKIPLNFVLLPMISKFYNNKDINSVQVYTQFSIEVYLMFAIPLVFSLWISSQILLPFFISSEEVQKAKYVLILISSAMFFTGLDQFFRNILMLQEKTLLLVSILIPIAIINLLLNYFLVPLYGAIGAGISTLTSTIVTALIIYWKSSQNFKYKFDIKRISKIFLSCIFFFLIIVLSPTNNFFPLFSALLLGGSIYIFVLFKLKCININLYNITFKR